MFRQQITERLPLNVLSRNAEKITGLKGFLYGNKVFMTEKARLLSFFEKTCRNIGRMPGNGSADHQKRTALVRFFFSNRVQFSCAAEGGETVNTVFAQQCAPGDRTGDRRKRLLCHKSIFHQGIAMKEKINAKMAQVSITPRTIRELANPCPVSA